MFSVSVSYDKVICKITVFVEYNNTLINVHHSPFLNSH